MVARGGDGDRVASGGLVSSTAGLIVDHDLLVHGGIAKVAVGVKQGHVYVFRTQCFVGEEIGGHLRTRHLNPAMRASVAREWRVDPVCPHGSLVPTTSGLIGDVDR